MAIYFHKPPHGSPGDEKLFFQGCFEDYRKNRGVTVVYSEEVWERWHSRLMELTMDGNTHLIYIPSTWLPEVGSGGILADLSELVPEYVEQWSSRYPESIFELGGISGGGQFGIPVYGAVWCFMYNEQLFKESGILSAPRTWDELWMYAEELKNKFPNLIPYGINDDSDGHFVDHGYVYLFSGGKSVWSGRNGSFRFDNENAVNGLSFLQRLVRCKAANLPIHSPSDWIRDQFFSGRIAMTVGPSDWVLWQRQNVPEFPLRVSMMPHPQGGRPLSFSSYGFYCVILGNRKRDFTDVVDLLNPSLLKRHIERIGMLPLQNDMALYEKDKELSVFSEQVKCSGVFPNEAARCFPLLTENMIACLKMEKTPIEALRNVTELMVEKET